MVFSMNVFKNKKTLEKIKKNVKKRKKRFYIYDFAGLSKT